VSVIVNPGISLSKDYPDKLFIPYRVLVSDEPPSEKAIWKALGLVFDWANRMGLEGKEIFDLRLLLPEPPSPLVSVWSLWCKVGCTETEKRAYYSGEGGKDGREGIKKEDWKAQKVKEGCSL
jgi:hypothetical protein